MTPPDTIEVCQRPFNAGICQGIIYHPQPNLSVCTRCGSKAPGVVYARVEPKS
jgi:hypothetical protein